MRKILLAVTLVALSSPAFAQSREVTCTGILVDVDMKSNAPWPLAVIYDANGGYTCAIDRLNAGHDPLRPCDVGERCSVVGIYTKKIRQTYLIKRFVSVARGQ
jgi:hypothetical protein